jgi:signal transduction histidine kinase
MVTGRRFPSRQTLQVLLVGILEIAVITGLAWVLRSVDPDFALAALYVLPVLHVATWSGFWPALLMAVTATLTFNFFFVHPVFAIAGGGAGSATTLVIFAIAGYVVSALAGRARRRAVEAESLARDISAADRQIRWFAEQQAALRRVATLVARATPPEEVFALVTAEVGQVLSADFASMARYDAGGAATIVGTWSETGTAAPFPVGMRLELGGWNTPTLVFQTARPARIDYADASGAVADAARERGIHSSVGAPISVEGRLWGVMGVLFTRERSLPADTETRLAGFTELVGTALANAEARAALTASRARIVAAADTTRRHIERDLHDGAQQRLVSLALQLRSTVQAALPPDAQQLKVQLDGIAAELGSVLDELREIARGLHPAALADGGLRPALKALGRRSAVPVRLDVSVDGRLSEPIELAAYYVVAEALTNAVKHAHATVIDVQVAATDGVLRVRVGDDGHGGADPTRGSGLVGLTDRVEALGGRLTLHSPPDAGTAIQVVLPLTAPSPPGPARGS